MNEINELLEGYCKWCNAQGGQCQLNLDGCAVGDALALLKEKPEPTEFLKECRALRLKGATEEQWEYAEKLGQACVYIDQLQARLDKTKKG